MMIQVNTPTNSSMLTTCVHTMVHRSNVCAPWALRSVYSLRRIMILLSKRWKKLLKAESRISNPGVVMMSRASIKAQLLAASSPLSAVGSAVTIRTSPAALPVLLICSFVSADRAAFSRRWQKADLLTPSRSMMALP